VPVPVAIEVDHLARARLGGSAARLFSAALVDGEHTLVPFTFAHYRRSVEIDDRYADLDLGLADASVMALAEGMDSPVLTFDFAHFRATSPARGFWRLVVDEAVYARATEG
jgi:predicted nucleic acid-binding protein